MKNKKFYFKSQNIKKVIPFTFYFLLFTVVSTFLNQPLLAQGISPPSGTPSFSTTPSQEGTVPEISPLPFTPFSSPIFPLLPNPAPEFSSTAGTEITPSPGFSTASPTAGTTPSPVFSATSSEKPTIPPLEEFKFKPMDWSRWSVGLIAGVYHPSLDTLNHILSTPSVGILQDPNFLLPGNPDFQVNQRNIVTPKIFGLAQYGVELQFDLNPKYSFTFAYAQWGGESRAEDTATIFTRSNQPPSLVPRDARYHVTLSQLWWGLRYHFYNEPGKKKLYLNIGLLGIAGAYLTMDTLERVITNNNLSFDSVSVTEASGYGFSTRFGSGGEIYLNKWLSLGINANYIIGRISTLKVTRYFSSGFGEFLVPPPDSLPPDQTVPIPQAVSQPTPGDTISYAQMFSVNSADYIGPQQNLILELDGFEVTFRILFHF